MRRVLVVAVLLISQSRSAMAEFVLADDLFVGEGTLRSTFSATPAASEPALKISSGVKIAAGGIRFPDGTVQYSSFKVNFSTRITPISYTIIGSTAAIPASTTTISLVKDQSIVRAIYSCDGKAETNGANLLVWALRGENVFGGESMGPTPRGILASGDIAHKTDSLRGILYDGPLGKGTYNYSLMGYSSGGDSALRNNQVCVFSLEELPQ